MRPVATALVAALLSGPVQAATIGAAGPAFSAQVVQGLRADADGIRGGGPGARLLLSHLRQRGLVGLAVTRAAGRIAPELLDFLGMVRWGSAEDGAGRGPLIVTASASRRGDGRAVVFLGRGNAGPMPVAVLWPAGLPRALMERSGAPLVVTVRRGQVVLHHEPELAIPASGHDD